MIELFYHPGFAAPIGNHVMPMRKFRLVAESLSGDPDFTISAPAPVKVEDLLRVHAEEYVDAVRSGHPKELAESQKFPWSPGLFSSVCLTNGAVLAASLSALNRGVAGGLASGFHHARAERGEGFCTFNGLVVALEALRGAGGIRTAAILDLDLHYGNGTASLAVERPWMRALSIYGNDYQNNVCYRDVSVRHHSDGPNHHSVPLLPSGAGDAANLLSILESNLPWLTAEGRPDLLLYQAGVDPLASDPYSPLNLSAPDLRARDLAVFQFARRQRIPVAWVLAGGYSEDISLVVEAHVNTARACAEVYR